MGHVGPTSSYYRSEGVPFLRTQNVGVREVLRKDLRYVTEAFHLRLKKSQLRAGDVVVSRVISDKINCAVIPEDLDGANCANIIVIRPGPKIDSAYLSHLISSSVAQRTLLERRVGSAQSVINTTILKKWAVPLPPLPEQHRIAAILDKADAIRRKRRWTVRLADEFLRSAFLDMFGDPISNPKGWPVTVLEGLVENDRGISYGVVQRGANDPDGVPIVRISNIVENRFDGTHVVRASPRISEKYKRTVIRGGELLLSIRGTVGRVAVAPSSAAGWNVSREVAVIPTTDEVNPEYLQQLMLTDGAQRFYGGNVRGVAQRGINLKDVRRLPVPLPDKRMLERYLAVVYRAQKLRSAAQQRDVFVDDLWGALVQRAFRGEL